MGNPFDQYGQTIVRCTSQDSENWVAFKLLDMECRPVGNARYQVRLPNGSLREGRLNAAGTVRIEDIPPGSCQICFPDYDEAAWHRLGSDQPGQGADS